MNDEFSELYNMLSMDREDIKILKQEYKHQLTMLMEKLRNFTITNIDIKDEYDLQNDFSKFKTDDVFIRYNLRNDITEYKLILLNKYLKELNEEKEFNSYIRDKEDNLSNDEYLSYVSNDIYKSELISKWYSEFKQKN